MMKCGVMLGWLQFLLQINGSSWVVIFFTRLFSGLLTNLLLVRQQLEQIAQCQILNPSPE